jgi:CRP-like cAMP-binding protein
VPGGPLSVDRLRSGQVLANQGEQDHTMWLVLDGLLHVDVDGVTVGEVGPGWVVGERASTDSGFRTATLRAVTPVRVVEVHHDIVRPEELARIAGTHAREELVHG